LAVSQTFKHAIIAAHPSAKSFTLSVAERYAETVRAHGHEAMIRDLYRTGFDPVLREQERQGEPAKDVTQEWALLGKVDVFVLVYPIWFGTPPAMLKGYIDRVFGAGRTLGWGGEGGEGEVLSGKRLVSLTSSGSMRAWLDEKGVLGSLRNVFDRYLAEVFGFSETARYHFDGIGRDLPEREARMHLKQVENAACECLGRMAVVPPNRNPNSR
jgi:NAD(P)H dehydrogenase (quinone)